MKNENTINDIFHGLSVEDFQYLRKTAKRTSSLFGIDIKDLKTLSFRVVKQVIPNCWESGDVILLIKEIFKEKDKHVTEQEINNEGINRIISFIFWILDSLEEINELENSQLSSIPEPEMINAGIENFNQFGIINIIDTLAFGDILKWKEIMELSYTDVFVKLKKNKLESEFNKKYHKIISSKK